jgi:hypothetical protein
MKEHQGKDSDFSIDDIKTFGDKKLIIVITILQKTMSSIEVLPEGVLDLYSVDIESEKTLNIETKEFDDVEKLKQEIVSYINSMKVF